VGHPIVDPEASSSGTGYRMNISRPASVSRKRLSGFGGRGGIEIACSSSACRRSMDDRYSSTSLAAAAGRRDFQRLELWASRRYAA